MNRVKTLFSPLVAVLTLSLITAGARAQDNNIMDIAERTPTLSKFVQMVELTGLEETLEKTGPYTIFAPTDAAFDKLGKEKADDLLESENKVRLTAILKNHIVPARISSREITVMGERTMLRTLGGGWLPIRNDNGVLVGKTRVERPDIIGTNGVIYLVDEVLLPEVVPVQTRIRVAPPTPPTVLVLIPVEKIRANPKGYLGKPVAGTVMVPEVPTDRGFWIEANGQRMFAVLDKSIHEDNVNVNAGQKVQLSGIVYDSAQWNRAGLGKVTPQTKKIIQNQPMFLVVKEIKIVSS